jgi:F-type H+-transporting ATPase subunit b
MMQHDWKRVMFWALAICALFALTASAADDVTTVEGERELIGEEIHEVGEKVTVNPLAFDSVKRDQALWTGVVFLVLLAVLWKFAWGPIAQGLDRREYGIADNIAQAEKANADARELLAHYERKLAEAQDEVRGIIDTGRHEAEKQASQIVERANDEADLRAQRAMREIDDATAGALKELANRSATLAVELAGRIVAGELKPADHQRLIEQAVNDFAKQN